MVVMLYLTKYEYNRVKNRNNWTTELLTKVAHETFS